MARILIDAYRIKDAHSGLGRFTQQYAEALMDAPHTGLRPTWLVPRHAELTLPAGTDQVRDGLLLRWLPRTAGRFTCWHSLYQLPSHRPPTGTPWIITVHDLNFLIEKKAERAQRYLRKLQQDLDRAAAVTAISEHTRSELERHIDLRGKPVRVIHNGVGTPALPDATLPTGIPQAPYFLSIGVLKPKKNVHHLLPLLAEFPEHHLVIAGNADTAYGAELRSRIAALPERDRVHLLGKVDDRARAALYAGCAALLFPSEAEGFGLPMIEALAMGRPVFAYGGTSLPEIGGDVAMYFRSFHPAEMAQVIRQGLERWDTEGPAMAQRAHVQATKFSWKACMEQYIQLYHDLLNSHAHDPLRNRTTSDTRTH